MKKAIIIIGIVFTLAVVAVGIWYWSVPHSHLVKTVATDKVASVETELQANPMLVGLWQEVDNPSHYRAYYEDPCDEEGYFWGKEWNEEEDVYEEDLCYHGNGWFKWCKAQTRLVIIYVGDNEVVSAPMDYVIECLDDTHLDYSNYAQTNGESVRCNSTRILKRTFHFVK